MYQTYQRKLIFDPLNIIAIMTTDSEFPGFGRDHFQLQKEKIKFVVVCLRPPQKHGARKFHVVDAQNTSK